MPKKRQKTKGNSPENRFLDRYLKGKKQIFQICKGQISNKANMKYHIDVWYNDEVCFKT